MDTVWLLVVLVITRYIYISLEEVAGSLEVDFGLCQPPIDNSADPEAPVTHRAWPNGA